MKLDELIIKVDAFSKTNKSFKAGEQWYNFDKSSPIPVSSFDKVFDELARGDSVKLQLTEVGWVDAIIVSEAVHAKVTEHNDKFEDIVSFDEILKKFTEKYKGKFDKSFEVLFADYDKEVFVVRVIVKTVDGVVSDIGDATPKSVKNEHIKPHYMRMAVTRGFGRCMKHILGIGKCLDEETSEAEGKDL
ncbi:MAG: hypothetical protein WC307_07275 [Candidatus Nanoarchaeia archaeon]|jgi:hypothetical protein